ERPETSIDTRMSLASTSQPRFQPVRYPLCTRFDRSFRVSAGFHRAGARLHAFTGGMQVGATPRRRGPGRFFQIGSLTTQLLRRIIPTPSIGLEGRPCLIPSFIPPQPSSSTRPQRRRPGRPLTPSSTATPLLLRRVLTTRSSDTT